jgi:large subunit ribosomal protein L30
MAKKEKLIRVTQIKSSIGRLEKHKACLTGLGLRRVGHSVDVADSESNRGMINKIAYMLRVEEAS